MVDQLPVPVLQTEDSEEDVMLITSQVLTPTSLINKYL